MDVGRGEQPRDVEKYPRGLYLTGAGCYSRAYCGKLLCLKPIRRPDRNDRIVEVSEGIRRSALRSLETQSP